MDPSPYLPPNPSLSGHQQPYARTPAPYSSFDLLNSNNGTDNAAMQGAPGETLPYGGPDDNRPRVKRKRASKACDACRVRKVKCDATQVPCPQCAEHEIPCLFTAPAKKRGPPNAYVEDQKRRLAQQMDQNQLYQPNHAAAYPPSSAPPTQPYGHQLAVHDPAQQHQAHSPSFLQASQPNRGFGLEHLASPEVINAALDDFFTYCYPTIPIVIEPLFRRKLADHSQHTSEFLALCGSMIAVSIALVRWDSTRFGNLSLQEASMFTTNHLGCHYRDQITVDTLSTLAFLGLAITFDDRCPLFENVQGAMLRAEFFTAAQYCVQSEVRAPKLDFVDRQRLGRMMVFVQLGEVSLGIQMIRIPGAPAVSAYGAIQIVPELLPRDISDSDLEKMTGLSPDLNATNTQFSELLVPSAKSYVAGLMILWEMYRCLNNTWYPRPDETRPRGVRYENCCKALDSLQHCLDKTPVELKWDENNKVHGIGFEVQKASLYINHMHLSSILLEKMTTLCSGGGPGADSAPLICDFNALDRQRRFITTGTLKILKTISRRALEANGSALITRVRQVASTLVDVVEHERNQGDLESHTARQELREFVEILGMLDKKEPPGVAEKNNFSSTREDGWRRFMSRSEYQTAPMVQPGL